jgi:dTDP-L-rhamnose 4-epimerase
MWQRTNEAVANPQNQYIISKIADEKVALHLGKRYGIPSVAMRYSIVQGPRQSFYNAYSGACRVFCLSFHQNQEPMIYEYGQQIRDFVNVLDVVDANVLVLHDDRANYEMFHVGGGKPYTVSQFASAVAEIFGRKNHHPKPCGNTARRHATSVDISKLQKLAETPPQHSDSACAYKHTDEADRRRYSQLPQQADGSAGVVREVAR